MGKNIFFKKKGPFFLHEILDGINIKKKIKVFDVKSLSEAENSDITFFDSVNYVEYAKSTKAQCCLTTDKLKIYLPKTCEPVIVKSVLFELCKVTKKFYPNAEIDYPSISLKKPTKTKYPKVRFGNNVLVGKNCKIGKNTIIGSNTIIEDSTLIGNDCVIGSQVVLKNSIIENNVVIQDGCKIGLKGFGFIPLNKKNLRFPHVGKVILRDNVELGANCTIDRGSIEDTIIGKNSFLDNQVHVAHNVIIV